MEALLKEYIRSIIPDDLKKGSELLAEGMEIGKKIQPQYSKYYLSRGYKDPQKAVQDDIKQGKSGRYCVNIGMATAEETLDACLELARWGKELGIEIYGGLLVPSMQIGVPKDKRDKEMDTTAFMLETLRDYEMFNREEIYMPVSNFNLACPNAIETAINCLEAGLPTYGSTSQLSWDYPGCENHKEDVENLGRALGILKANEEYHPNLGCYIEDGLAGCCVDTISYIAYFLFEQYIYTDLCGITVNPCFGALISDLKTRIGLMVAADDVAKEKGGFLSFIHGTTTQQWDHDVAGNLGAGAQEMLMTFLAEDHYKTGTCVLAVPATEAITVPTLPEIKDAIAATSRTREYVEEWRDLIDWSEIDERIYILKREGRKMFRNMLGILEDAGVDINDPIPLLKFIKDVDTSLFEQSFHPSVVETGVFKPWFPNDMGKVTMNYVEEALAKLKEAGYGKDVLKGKTVVVGSTDIHAYGVRFVNSVLTELGANVSDMGVDNSPQHMLDMAAEIGTAYVCASTHSGNALAIGNYFEQFIRDQNRDCQVMMGGILTSILPGHSEPSQVDKLLNENEHILATNDIRLQVEKILETL